MNFKRQISRFVIIYVFIFAGCINSSLVMGTGISGNFSDTNNSVVLTLPHVINNSSREVEKLNGSLKGSLNILLSGGDKAQSLLLIEKIIKIIDTNDIMIQFCLNLITLLGYIIY
jgi:hypothetical protein